MSLQPNFCFQGGARDQLVAAQRALIYQNLETHFSQIHVYPIKLAARKRIAQWLAGDDSSGETPVVLVRGARRSGFFQRQPTQWHRRSPHASAIGQSAKAHMQLLGAKSCWANLGKILQFKQHFGVGTVTVAM